MNTIIFDTETTGLPKPSLPLDQQPKIIELGGVFIDKTGVLRELSQLINPEEKLPEIITKITGITDKDLDGQPTFKEFLPDLIKFFEESKTLIAHNAKFDTTMLRNDLLRVGCDDFPWPENIVCTVQEYQPRFGKYMKLTNLYASIMKEELVQTHRALDDVNALYALLMKDNFFGALDDTTQSQN